MKKYEKEREYAKSLRKMLRIGDQATIAAEVGCSVVYVNHVLNGYIRNMGTDKVDEIIRAAENMILTRDLNTIASLMNDLRQIEEYRSDLKKWYEVITQKQPQYALHTV